VKSLADRTPVALLVVLAVGVVAAAGGITYAAFSASTTNPSSSFESMAVFPRDRGTSAWDIRDNTSGSEVNQSGPVAFTGDGRTDTTKTWSNLNAYNTANYLEFDFNDPLPAGRAVSGVELKFRYAAASGRTACFYADVRKASDGTVLATYGGTGADLGCVTGTTQTTHTVSLPIVTTTDIANDLLLRVYVRQSGSTAAAITIDRVAVVGSYTYSNFVLYRTRDDDRANASTTITPWGPALTDSTAYVTSTVTSSFNANEWVKFKFPTTVPTGADLTSASVSITYRSGSGTTCFYYEVLNGSTVLQTVGSTGTPADCNSTGAFEAVPAQVLSSVDTPAEANNLTLKIYLRNSGSQTVQFDLIRMNTTWSVDAGAGSGTSCTDPGSQSVVATRDSWLEQGSPSANHGTSSDLYVRTKSSQNSRSVLYFALPTVPSGCSVTEATLRVVVKSSAAGRTIEAYQLAATPSWTETGITWSTQPATTGTAATSASLGGSGTQQWNVASLVQAMLAGTNNGFLLKDSVENSGTEYIQIYAAREDSSLADATLVLSWN
jgi:hypothetical protein